jgi:hypothetical protein
MVLFRRPRVFKPTADGSFAVHLSTEAREWLVDLADQLDGLLDSDTGETRRLFPTAYPDDPELDAGYQILARQELTDGRRAAIELMRSTSSSDVFTETELAAWMGIVNDLRLVLGTKLDVGEDDEEELDVDRPDFEAQLVYRELGLLLGEIVDALATTLPETTSE